MQPDLRYQLPSAIICFVCLLTGLSHSAMAELDSAHHMPIDQMTGLGHKVGGEPLLLFAHIRSASWPCDIENTSGSGTLTADAEPPAPPRPVELPPADGDSKKRIVHHHPPPRKPNPSKYSYTIWRVQTVPTGQRVSAMTPYGKLVCFGSTPGGPPRPCHWE
jgi:hypothetical protein